MNDADFFPGYAQTPCVRLLGWSFVASDPAAGTVTLGFTPDASMCNPGGAIQGGFVAAMLDEAMGGAFVASTHAEQAVLTIDMNVTYLAPVLPGSVTGKGRVIGRTRSTAFLEAELFDADGALLARATSTGRVVDIKR